MGEEVDLGSLAEEALATLHGRGLSVEQAAKVLSIALGKILFVTGRQGEHMVATVSTSKGTYTVEARLTEATYAKGTS